MVTAVVIVVAAAVVAVILPFAVLGVLTVRDALACWRQHSHAVEDGADLDILPGLFVAEDLVHERIPELTDEEREDDLDEVEAIWDATERRHRR